MQVSYSRDGVNSSCACAPLAGAQQPTTKQSAASVPLLRRLVDRHACRQLIIAGKVSASAANCKAP